MDSNCRKEYESLLVAVAAALVWFRVWEPFAHVSIIGIVGTLIGIYPILKEAAENVMERRMTMELSMTIAILAALAIGQFFTALIIVLFVLIAEVLEGLTVQRGRTAIRELLNLLPNEVTVRRNGRAEQRSTESIRPGEIIEVNPGARIPVDGDVVGGNSFVDQATITGESLPVEKLPGSIGLRRHGQSVWRAGDPGHAGLGATRRLAASSTRLKKRSAHVLQFKRPQTDLQGISFGLRSAVPSSHSSSLAI